ncbi:FAD-binding oxidoreductase [Pseudonocardia sp. C8]|uniref:NAD(P)/FAD-dependent oxidoreductase n=1 Tax=Pseudonocardia sp. C8 TaxID=2762759 RepID=UPI001642A382|nr:FAD-binding oxidoreductase [Pseudonocardia sp. C8]MBC3193707.1 FAD-binding oxidoreductase [Pseudonocardia sp. C8]
MAAPRHVVVLGGGILGISTATHVQRTGVPVTLVTDGELGDGASGRSLSWLNSAGDRSQPYHALRMAGIDRYRTLFAEDPTRDWLRFDGGLHWSAAGHRADEETRHAAEASHGYDSRLLAADDVATAVPGVAKDAVPELAIHNRGEGWVSLPHLIDHLAAEFSRLGGRIVTAAGRGRVVVEHGRARAVVAGTGARYDGDAVVVACGAGTPGVVSGLGVSIPDASPLSMLVTTTPSDAGTRAVINSPRVAMRPDPSGGYALDHSWYEEAIREANGTPSIDVSIVHELVAEANAVLDGADLRPGHWRLGRKPIPGDGEPVLGELDRVPGCFVAFTHSGATLGLIAGELLAAEVCTGARNPMLDTFRPERFVG